jgi:hypothetical protein
MQHRQHRKHRFQQLFCCCVCIRFVGTCSPSRCLVTAGSSGSTTPAFRRWKDTQAHRQQGQVRVTLRPTVSRPVSPGVKPHLGPLSDIRGFVDVGRPL